MAIQEVSITNDGVITPLLVVIMLILLIIGLVTMGELEQIADNSTAMLKIMQAQQAQQDHDRMMQECHK